MSNSMSDILRPGNTGGDADFPHAPEGWTRDSALTSARDEDIDLTDDHWRAIQALQDYHARNGEHNINVRAVTDALDEKFHRQGGLKYLYLLFPGGPIGQGCRIAGLKPPAGAIDPGFGSVI